MAKYPTLPIPFARPKSDELQWEDVNWRLECSLPSFEMIGLCGRHVQIDDTGRDWYGLPLIVDPVAAPLQGSPYVAALDDANERELNKLLWQARIFDQGEHHFWIKSQYRSYVKRQQARPGEGMLSLEQFWYRCLIRDVLCHNLPNPRIAKYFIEHETEEEYRYQDALADERLHQRYASNLERFHLTNWVARIGIALDGLINSCRQRIVFERLKTAHATRLAEEKVLRQRDSNQQWAIVDGERAAARQHAQQLGQTAAPAEQLSMFA